MNRRISVSGLNFPHLDLADTLDALAQLGAHTTTLQARKMRAAGWETAIESVLSSGIDVAGLVASFPETLGDRSSHDAVRADLVATVDAAAVLGAPMVYNVTGPEIDGSAQSSVDTYAEMISPVVDRARGSGVAMAVEPTLQSYAWVSFVHTLADVRSLCRRTGLGVCLDLRHVWDDPDLANFLETDIGSVALVQVGDSVVIDGVVDAVVPGDGVVPLADCIRRIEAAGYTGVYDLEVVGPRMDVEGHIASSRRSVAALESYLGS